MENVSFIKKLNRGKNCYADHMSTDELQLIHITSRLESIIPEMLDKGKIIFLLPTISIVPVGGYKIVMQYANKMAEDGYDVTIAYAGFIWRFFKNKSLKEKCGYIKNRFCIVLK